MNKITSFCAAVALLATTSHAAINLQWSAPDGFLQSNDSLGIVETISTAWVQLIFTPDATALLATPGGGVQGNEQIIDQFGISDAGGADPYGTFVRDTVATFQAGNLYARVFDGGSDPASGIVAGMWYYESALFATVDNLTPESPTTQNIQGNNPSVTFAGFGDVVNRQVVVPEPSVIAFLGLGGLALAARRRFVA